MCCSKSTKPRVQMSLPHKMPGAGQDTAQLVECLVRMEEVLGLSPNKASLVYRASFRTAMATQKSPVLKVQTNNNVPVLQRKIPNKYVRKYSVL